MTTLKLKKPTTPFAPSERRGPLRAGGIKRRPTLAEAEAERRQRQPQGGRGAPGEREAPGQRGAGAPGARSRPPSQPFKPSAARNPAARRSDAPLPPLRRRSESHEEPRDDPRFRSSPVEPQRRGQADSRARPFDRGQPDPRARPFDRGQPDPRARPFDRGQPDSRARPFDRGQPDPRARPFDRGQPDPRARPFDRGQPDPRGQAFERPRSGPRPDPRTPPRPAPGRVGDAPGEAPQHGDRQPVPASTDKDAGSLRVSKRMSELGLASRREADEWIERGLVKVDGVVVDRLGARVLPGQQITVEPDAQLEQAQRVTVLLHKPLGYVSGQAEDGHTPALMLVNADSRWRSDPHRQRFNSHQLRHLVPAGRLDLDSTGLLVLTQDGRIAKQLIGEDSLVEKEYVVQVRWNAEPDNAALHTSFPAELLERLRHGLELDGKALEPAKVSWQSECRLRMVLREGRKRQIRRMCEAVDLQVLELKRIRIGRVGLGELPVGQWRYLGPFETFV